MSEKKINFRLPRLIQVLAWIVGLIGVIISLGGFIFSTRALLQARFQTAGIIGISLFLGLYFVWAGFSTLKNINIKKVKHLSAAIVFIIWSLVFNVFRNYFLNIEDNSRFRQLFMMVLFASMFVLYFVMTKFFSRIIRTNI
jgi:uncharacterized membrane protein